ncbi:MAG: phosphotransferase [Desulfobacterales bacterium]|nr:phosphotransferase [Desulfobacterales bacterium]MBS3754127.1 phosphotransferase [Desulfobacterales bacterium]
MPPDSIKALVLAAGLGARLRPYSQKVPKPLFPVAGRPIMDIIISRLIDAGISAIGVNTHHLSDQMEAFLLSRSYPVPVIHRHETQLLGTGGAIRNFADFLGSDRPFVVINSDVLTDISISGIISQHMADCCAATLAVVDRPEFNSVSIAPNERITGFAGNPAGNEKCLTFTGIQVIDPVIFDYLPAAGFAGSIEAFCAMIQDGLEIRAYETSEQYWNDLGTPERYRRAVIDTIGPEAFARAFGRPPESDIDCTPLAGDGSDRKWLRARSKERSLVIADHGIQTEAQTTEFDAFVAIGSHLHQKGLAVPAIYMHDRFSGLVFLDDLGDTLLQSAILAETDPAEIENHYHAVINSLLEISTAGAEGFDPAWGYQEPVYSRQTIIEKEGLYFVRTFLQKWLGMENVFESKLVSEFDRLADVIETHGAAGFMHRDMQSRNIMAAADGYYFIDFQGGRRGPIQYDLASLITDPYVDLRPQTRQNLLAYAADRLAPKIGIDRTAFYKGYHYCAIARNLQALGAFGHLSGAGRKPQFAAYMQPALNNLSALLASAEDPALPWLAETVARARDRLGANFRQNPR